MMDSDDLILKINGIDGEIRIGEDDDARTLAGNFALVYFI